MLFVALLLPNNKNPERNRFDHINVRLKKTCLYGTFFLDQTGFVICGTKMINRICSAIRLDGGCLRPSTAFSWFVSDFYGLFIIGDVRALKPDPRQIGGESSMEVGGVPLCTIQKKSSTSCTIQKSPKT